MKITQRQSALNRAKFAGYHDDTKTFTRLIIESRVNRQAMNESFLTGRTLKAGGMKCNCSDCQRAAA